MSKLSESEVNHYLTELLEKCLDVIQNGINREHLIRQIFRTVERLETDASKRRCKATFLSNLTNNLKGKRAHNINHCSLFLYRLWEKLGASDDVEALLRTVPWYVKPTEERLKMDDRRSGRLGKNAPIPHRVTTNVPCDVKSTVKVVTHKSSSKSSPQRQSDPTLVPKRIVHSSALSISTPPCLARDSKQSSRKRVKEVHDRSMISSRDQPTSTAYLKEKSSSPETDHFIGPLSKKYIAAEKERNRCTKSVKPKADWLYAFLDLEGVAPDLAEIAVIVCDGDMIVSVRLYHLKVKSKEVLRNGSKFCHGIEYNELMKRATHTEREAAEEIRAWLESLGRVCVVSADEQENSDVSKFVLGWNVAYVNFPLPRWAERVTTRAHILAQANKSKEVTVHGVSCPYQLLHQDKLLRKDKGLSLSNGAHCSLADSYELYLHIKLNHLWNVLKRLADVSPRPHQSSW
jgi:hypothetical protein